MKRYADTKAGAIQVLKEQSCVKFTDDQAVAVIDPHVEGVWLVFIETKKENLAFIVYVMDGDFEDVDYNEAYDKYHPYRLKK